MSSSDIDGEPGSLSNMTQAPRRGQKGWLFAVLALAIAAGASLVAYTLLLHHERASRRLELDLLQTKLAAQQAQEEQKLISSLIREVLLLRTEDFHRRDRTLELIAQLADDRRIRGWAAGQRKLIAPALRRLDRLAGRAGELALPGIPPPGTRFADQLQEKGAAAEQGSPQWKRYLKAREELRRTEGRYCCKITTGKILFARADTSEQCRQHAQALCLRLAAVAQEKQKCFYVLASDCTRGEILGSGDVAAEPSS